MYCSMYVTKYMCSHRPMFIGPPKLVFIKTTEATGGAAGLRPGAPKGQTILVAPAPTSDSATMTSVPSPATGISLLSTIASFHIKSLSTRI